jgi:hypothetical protein
VEIKLYFKNGDLESHVLPEYSGRTVTRREGDEKRTDVVTTELDVLTDVVETLQVRDSGVFLSRRICVNEDARRNLGVEVTRGSAGRIRILSAERMSELERVAADGEVVWPPEEAGIEGEISRLEQMVEQLD